MACRARLIQVTTIRIAGLATLVLVAVPAAAQTADGVGPKVRLTAAATFDLPNVIHIDNRRVSGSHIVSSDDEFVRVVSGTPERLITVPLPGHQFVAIAVSIDGETLSVKLR